MSVPRNVHEGLRRIVWHRADALCWLNLAPQEKTRHYDNWSKDPEIGRVLVRYLEPNQVHRYIKDSLMGRYNESKLADQRPILLELGLQGDATAEQQYTRPLGLLLSDGRVVCWGMARDWKAVLLALHERAFALEDARPFGFVLTNSAKLFPTMVERQVVNDAAEKLGVEVVRWRME